MKKIFFLVILFLVFLLLMTGCSDFVAPDGAVAFNPPTQYKVWWNEIQSCVNKEQKRDWNDIEWYHVDDYIYYDGYKAVGYTHNNKIFFSDWYVFDQQGNFLLSPADAWAIQHELVHAIDKINGHPDDPFVKCKLMNYQQVPY